MEKLKYLVMYCSRMGLRRGLMLSANIYFRRLNNLSVPGVKHPISLRSGSSDLAMFSQVFGRGDYDMSLNVSKLPPPINVESQPVMIDGGANIGLFTVLMKNRYPNAKIICVEPDPENFALLQRNVAPYSDVYCEHCGLWGKDTQLKAYDKYGYGKCGIITEESAEEGNVAAISMGSLLKKYGVQTVDVLKLDIESSEKQVFGSGFEAWLPKVKTLIVELHDSTEAGCAKAFFEAIQQTFSGYKFSVQGENVIIEQIP